VDGSAMTTGGAVNPTSTIQAVALWIAEAIVRAAKGRAATAPARSAR